MFRKAGFFCAALAMFFIAGGHWAMLQSVAWAQMLGNYSQRTGSVAVAVAQTFDGQHPCELCQEIQAAKSRENKQNNARTEAGKRGHELKALRAESTSTLPALCVVDATHLRPAAPVLVSRADPPPVPPPRRGSTAA